MKKILSKRFISMMLLSFALIITTVYVNPIHGEARDGYHTYYCGGCKSESSKETHTISDHGAVDFWDYCGACGQYAKHWRRSWGYDCNGSYHETAAQVNIYAGTYDKGLYCTGTNNQPNSSATSGTVECSNHTRTWCPGHEAANTYTIVFNGNGATSGSMNNLGATYDQNAVLPALGFSKTDYNFLGWSTSATGSVVYGNGATVKNLTTVNGGTVTLYAIWQPNKKNLSVTANLDGTDVSSTSGFGTFSVTAEGSLTNNLTSYNKDLKYNSAYSVSNIAAKPGYTYTGASGTLSGNMNDNKAIKLKFTTNSYKVTLTAGTGISSVSGSGTFKYNTAVTIDAVVKPGYTWSKWSGTHNYSTKYTTFYVPASNVTMTASATPNKDTVYTVKHYQQNIYDNNYTLVETQTFKGTTDTKVTPAVKTYTGFTSPSTQTVNIDGDGKRVVNYYYTRNSYTVDLIAGNGVSYVAQEGKYRYGQTVYINANIYEGYTWKNWTGTATYTDKSTSFTMPAYNVTLTANCTNNQYYVDYDKGQTNNGGTVGSTLHTWDKDVTLAANKFTGRSYKVEFNMNKPDTKGALSNIPNTISGNLSFNCWDVKATYNSGRYSANTNLGKKNFESKQGNRAKATAVWNNSTLSWNNPNLQGYDFTGWVYSNGTPLSGSSITVSPSTVAFSEVFKATWKPRNDTPYKVNHWVQNIDAASDELNSKNFTLVSTDNLKGTSDSYVKPKVNTYEGCISPAVVTVRIEADGSTVVNYYYLRYKLSLNIDGEYLKQHYPTTDGLATFDIYINNKLVANDVKEYINDKILYGSTWEIKDINPVQGKHYSGTDIETIVEKQ